MRLVDDMTLLRVQNNLLESRQIKDLHGSWWFNILMFFSIIGVIIFFLITQYNSTRTVLEARESRKDIPRQELTWNNAIRNNIEL
jgi:hypothetical protein